MTNKNQMPLEVAINMKCGEPFVAYIDGVDPMIVAEQQFINQYGDLLFHEYIAINKAPTKHDIFVTNLKNPQKHKQILSADVISDD